MLSLILRIWTSVLQLVSRSSQILKVLDELKAARAADTITLQNMQSQLEQILDQLVPGPAVAILFTVDLEGQVTEGVTRMKMEHDQQAVLTIQPVDRKGKPAPVDGPPAWESSNSEVVTVEAAADGLSATIKGVGPLTSPGTPVTISVSADADLGAGSEELIGTLDVDIVAGKAVSITITAGTPTDQ